MIDRNYVGHSIAGKGPGRVPLGVKVGGDGGLRGGGVERVGLVRRETAAESGTESGRRQVAERGPGGHVVVPGGKREGEEGHWGAEGGEGRVKEDWWMVHES